MENFSNHESKHMQWIKLLNIVNNMNEIKM